MKSGLDILRQSRPELVEALGNFLQQLGTHLDGRTRQLIQVALNAAQGARPTLKLHLIEAVRQGATRDEILDALTLTLPMIGLPAVMEAVAFADEVLDQIAPRSVEV